MAHHLYIGLTKSDLYTQNRVALSDKRRTLFLFKYSIFLLQTIRGALISVLQNIWDIA